MSNALTMSQSTPARVLLVGYPGAAKTGSLASLVNAGYKIRILDFDGNLKPLFTFSDPKMLGNVDIVTCQDALRMGAQVIEVKGLPKAYETACKMMDHWKYKEGDKEFDLGRPSAWGGDTIVVLDSLTSMGTACMNRAMSIGNRTSINLRQADWGVAINMQKAFLELLLSQSNNFHVVVLSHLKIISPKNVEKADEDTTKTLKTQLIELIPSRLYPSALGQGLPTDIAKMFDTVMLVERQVQNNKTKRVMTTKVGQELDVKVPLKSFPDTLSIDDGMLKLFEALVPWSVPGSSGAKKLVA